VTRELIETLFRPFRLLELRALRTLLSLFSLGLLGRLSVRDDTARDVLSLSFPLGFSFEIKKNLDSIEVVAFVPFVEKVRWLTAHLFVDSLEEAEKGPPIS
jgi:hypothetical protein